MCERHGVQGGDFGKHSSRGEIVAGSDDNEEEVDVDVACVESLSEGVVGGAEGGDVEFFDLKGEEVDVIFGGRLRGFDGVENGKEGADGVG